MAVGVKPREELEPAAVEVSGLTKRFRRREPRKRGHLRSVRTDKKALDNVSFSLSNHRR